MKRRARIHRFFRRWEPYVGLGLGTGLFGWLARRLSVFGQLGWAEAIFLGLVAAVLLAFGLAAYRYWRPLSPARADHLVAQSLPATPAIAPAERKNFSLPPPEKPRVSAALLAVVDRLEDVSQFSDPIRAILGWSRILANSGTEGLVDAVERARLRAREIPNTLASGIQPHATELKLVGISAQAVEQSIETQSAAFDTVLHAIGSIAHSMKPEDPNEASFNFSGQIFASAFGQFEAAIEAAKQEISDARFRLAQGDMG